MKVRWAGVVLVAIAALAIVGYKQHRILRTGAQLAKTASLDRPEIIAVVDPREADTADNCAEIIRIVQAEAARGTAVEQLSPDSASPLLKRYHVLTIPTVLILDHDGNVISRYEGEENSTVAEIRKKLANSGESKH